MNKHNVNQLTVLDNIFLIICTIMLLIGTFTPTKVLTLYEAYIHQALKQFI